MNHNTCPFCGQAMSEENFGSYFTNTCRNHNCGAFSITLTPAAWATMTLETLQSYINGRTPYAASDYSDETVTRPADAQTVILSVERMGAKQFVIFTGVDFEKCHSIDSSADIERYATMYQSQGYKVVRS